MNNPLRYDGETYYQSGFDRNDARVTILQVVRNPSWLTPYVACILVSLGLTPAIYVPFDRLRQREEKPMKKWLPWIITGIMAAWVLSTLPQPLRKRL